MTETVEARGVLPAEESLSFGESEENASLSEARLCVRAVLISGFQQVQAVEGQG